VVRAVTIDIEVKIPGEPVSMAVRGDRES